LIFKLAFTVKDAPELTYGLSAGLVEKVETLELVGLARMVFGGLLLSGTWVAFAEWTRSQRRKKRGKQGNGRMLTASCVDFRRLLTFLQNSLSLSST
jgi:ethanolaminephosphotransferase